ncbi:MAG: hypothetical protein LBS28_01840 [Streptococcaceae bacterium]|jgi:hypothetical protein|nr:hypothetical protein [Streptococcaceae bacterium]
MENSAGGMGHSLITYAAVQYNNGQLSEIKIYDPGSGVNFVIPVDSPTAINLIRNDRGSIRSPGQEGVILYNSWGNCFSVMGNNHGVTRD